MPDETRGRIRKFSDQQLRAGLEEGLTAPELAERFDCSPQAVYERINRLALSTLAAATAPEESRRHVRAQVNALEELQTLLEGVRPLFEACQEYLADPERPECYDVGARASDVTVIYQVLVEAGNRSFWQTKREKLQTLLDRVGGVGEIQRTEVKHADPRELLLKASAELRAILDTGVQLTARLLDAKAQEAWREEVLAAIGEVDEETRAEIVKRIRRRLAVRVALGESGAL